MKSGMIIHSDALELFADRAAKAPFVFEMRPVGAYEETLKNFFDRRKKEK